MSLRVTRPCCSLSGAGDGEREAPPSRWGSEVLWLEAAPVEGLERWGLSTEHFWVRATKSESDASKFPFNSSHCCDQKGLCGPGRGRGSREPVGVVEGRLPRSCSQYLEGAAVPSFQPQGSATETKNLVRTNFCPLGVSFKGANSGAASPGDPMLTKRANSLNPCVPTCTMGPTGTPRC